MDEQGGLDSKNRLSKVNPLLFRNLKYQVIVSPDVIAPMSEELEASWSLQMFDKMVAAPGLFDPEMAAKLLLEAGPKTRKHVQDYISKTPFFGPPPPPQNQPTQGGQAPTGVGQIGQQQNTRVQ